MLLVVIRLSALRSCSIRLAFVLRALFVRVLCCPRPPMCIVSIIHPREDGLTLPQRSTRVRDTMRQQDFRTAVSMPKRICKGGMQPVRNLFRSEKRPTRKLVDAEALVLSTTIVGDGDDIHRRQGRGLAAGVFRVFRSRSRYLPVLTLPGRWRGSAHASHAAGIRQHRRRLMPLPPLTAGLVQKRRVLAQVEARRQCSTA